jgi:hypothetical protein
MDSIDVRLRREQRIRREEQEVNFTIRRTMLKNDIIDY